MSLLTMLAAFTPVLADLDVALAGDLFLRTLTRLCDLKSALRTEARACFVEFVSDVSRLDSWKGASAATSVRCLSAGLQSWARGECAHVCGGSAE